MSKRVLAVLAHPERRSLNGVLFDAALKTLKQNGHEVRVSDLYRMDFKPTIDRADFPRYTEDTFTVSSAIRQAEEMQNMPEDVVREQQKILWAECLIFQFPIWWFSAPAILKGWLDRVMTFGFTKNIAKKKILMSVTAASPTPKSLNDPQDISNLLRPISFGLSCTGGIVMPPLIFYDVYRTDDARLFSHLNLLKSHIACLTSFTTLDK